MNLSTENFRKTERISFVDTAKCLLVIWVVLVHINYDFDPGTLPEWISYPYYMPAFFYLSGFFHRQRAFVEQVKAKSRALLIPFCFFYIISYIWTWAFHLTCNIDSTSIHNISWFLSLSPSLHYSAFNGALWFFLVLFAHSVLYTPLQKLLSKMVVRMMVLFALSVFGLFLWSKQIFPLAHFCYFYVFYAAGAEYGQLIISSMGKIKSLIAALFLIGILITFNSIQDSTPFFSCIPYAIRQEFAAFIFIPIALTSCFYIDRIRFINSILRFFGKNSVVIFAIHMPYYTHLYTRGGRFFLMFLGVCACFAIICNKYCPLLLGKK